MFSVKVLFWFSNKVVHAFSFFLFFFLLAIHFCLSSVYYSFNFFSVQSYHFFPMVSFSSQCPCSFFISSKAKHESLLSELFQIWWNELTYLRLEVLYCVFPFLAYLSQILLVWPYVLRQGWACRNWSRISSLIMN